MSLELQISADDAAQSLDRLVSQIDALEQSLQGFDSAGFDKFADSVASFQGINPTALDSITQLNQLMTNLTNAGDISRVVDGLNQLANIDMASVAQSVQQLSDALSTLKIPPGLGDLAQYLERAGTAAQKAGVDLGKLNSDANQAQKSLEDLGRRAEAAGQKFLGIEQGAGTAGKAMDIFATSMNGWVKAAELAILVLGAFSFVKMAEEGLKAAEAVETFSRKINAFTSDTNAGSKALQFVISVADQTGQSLEGLTGVYSKFAPAAQKAGYSVDSANQAFLNIARGARAAGADTEKLQTFMNFVARSMDSGVVSGYALARAMQNLGPVQRLLGADFQNLARASNLNIGVFQKIADEMGKFKQPAMTLQEELQRVANSWQELTIAFGQGVMQTEVAGATALADAMRTFAPELDAAAHAAGAFWGVIRSAFDYLRAGVVVAVGEAVRVLQGLWDILNRLTGGWLGTIFSGLATGAMYAAEAVGFAFRSIFEGTSTLITALGNVADFIYGGWSVAWARMTEGLITAWEWLKAFGNWIAGVASGAWNSLPDWLQNTVVYALQAAGNAVKWLWDQLAGFFNWIVSWTSGPLSSVWNWLIAGKSAADATTDALARMNAQLSRVSTMPSQGTLPGARAGNAVPSGSQGSPHAGQGSPGSPGSPSSAAPGSGLPLNPGLDSRGELKGYGGSPIDQSRAGSGEVLADLEARAHGYSGDGPGADSGGNVKYPSPNPTSPSQIERQPSIGGPLGPSAVPNMPEAVARTPTAQDNEDAAMQDFGMQQASSAGRTEAFFAKRSGDLFQSKNPQDPNSPYLPENFPGKQKIPTDSGEQMKEPAPSTPPPSQPTAQPSSEPGESPLSSDLGSMLDGLNGLKDAFGDVGDKLSDATADLPDQLKQGLDDSLQKLPQELGPAMDPLKSAIEGLDNSMDSNRGDLSANNSRLSDLTQTMGRADADISGSSERLAGSTDQLTGATGALIGASGTLRGATQTDAAASNTLTGADQALGDTMSSAADTIASAIANMPKSSGNSSPGNSNNGGNNNNGGNEQSSPGSSSPGSSDYTDSGSPDMGSDDSGGDSGGDVPMARYGGLTNSPTSFRRVDAARFSGAPHFADGGISDGIPSILHPNEAVIPLRNGSVPVSGANNANPMVIKLTQDIVLATRATNQSVREQMGQDINIGVAAHNDAERAYQASLEFISVAHQIISKLDTIRSSGGGGGGYGSGGASGGVTGVMPGSQTQGGPSMAASAGDVMMDNDSGQYYRPVDPHIEGGGTWMQVNGKYAWWKPSSADYAKNKNANSGGYAMGSPNVFDEEMGRGATVTIHPDEAVIPLPDGRSVPIDGQSGIFKRIDDFIAGGGQDHVESEADDSAPQRGRRGNNQQSGNNRGVTVINNWNITTPNADSFRASKNQTLQRVAQQTARAIKTIGNMSDLDDPTVRNS